MYLRSGGRGKIIILLLLLLGLQSAVTDAKFKYVSHYQFFVVLEEGKALTSADKEYK